MSTFGLSTSDQFTIFPDSPRDIGADLILPAGGPWIIFGLWAQAIESVFASGLGFSGYVHFESVSGDIVPDPAPGNYPIFNPGTITTNSNQNWCIPTIIHPVLWEAAGKSKIKFQMINTSVNTWPLFAYAGIIFGDTIPQRRPRIFSDIIHSAIVDNVEVLIGTFTLSEKASRITAILADVKPVSPANDNQSVGGFFRLDSDDAEMNPTHLPFARYWPASKGGTGGGATVPKLDYIDLDIPIPGGARVNVFAKLEGAFLNPIDINVYIAYE